MSSASENSPNLSFSLFYCFLGHCQCHGHWSVFSWPHFWDPISSWTKVTDSPKAGSPMSVTSSYTISPFSSIYLYSLISTYISSIHNIFIFGLFVFFFVFMSVPCLPSSPGKPTLSTVNGNYLRQPVYQNQWPVECLTVWLCHRVFNYCYHFVSILLYFLITICSEVTVKGSDKVPNFTSMKHELFCATQGLFFLVDSGEVQFPWQLIAFLELHKVSKRQENIFLPSLVHTCMVFTQVHFTGRYLVFFNRESAKVSKYILRVKWGNAVLFNVYSINVLCIFIFLSKNAKEYLVNL